MLARPGASYIAPLPTASPPLSLIRSHRKPALPLVSSVRFCYSCMKPIEAFMDMLWISVGIFWVTIIGIMAFGVNEIRWMRDYVRRMRE